MIIKQLSVFLENKKGRLAAVMSELAGHNIDVSALSLADTTDFGVLRLIVNRPEEAKRVLTDSGVTVRITDMVATVMADRPGGAQGGEFLPQAARRLRQDRLLVITGDRKIERHGHGRASLPKITVQSIVPPPSTVSPS